MTSIRFNSTVALLVFSVGAFGQDQPQNAESGSVNLYTTSGWSFGFPSVRAAVAVPGRVSIISPEKTTLPTYGVGVGVRAWKFLVPFVDFTAIDTGKATAQIGSFSSTAQANTFTFDGGLRLIGARSRVRPYAEFGGGAVHQDLKGNFIVGGVSTPLSGSATVGSFLYGGGLQFFWGRKWGSDIGFDGYRVSQPLNGAGQNFNRVSFGLFYQTKSSVQ